MITIVDIGIALAAIIIFLYLVGRVMVGISQSAKEADDMRIDVRHAKKTANPKSQ